jgi:hypothetical protein
MLDTHPATTAEVIREIAAGHGLSCAQGARLFPGYRKMKSKKVKSTRPSQPPDGRGLARTDPSTVFRWIVDGARLDNGERVHLEAAKLCGRWLTTEKCLPCLS